MNKKQEKIERQNTERKKRRGAETSDAIRRTPRGSEIRKEKKRRDAEKRIAEGCRECQVTKRRKREREEEKMKMKKMKI